METMLSNVGRWGLASSHGAYSVGSLFNVSCCVGSSVQGLRHGRIRKISDRRPPFVRLADAVLGCDPRLLLAGTDPKSINDARVQTFQNLDLGLPEKLSDSYSSSEDYHDRLKRLVVEETLYSTVAALKAFQEKKAQLVQKDRVRIHVTGDRSNTNRPWFEAYSYEPLTPWNRRHLRAGSVFVMIPDGGQYDKDLIFGVIRLGSERSQYLPKNMQDKKAKRLNSKNDNGKGDRLAFNIYGEGSENVEADHDYELQYLTSILTFQRQFQACEMSGHNSTFDNELFAESQVLSSPSADTSDSVGNASTYGISMPALNESQNRACSAFLSDGGPNIHIVQGPPGTGKTTMTIATILKVIVTSREKGERCKLLVCGPTNKSVVVLARKFLDCLGDDSSIKASLVGDKGELLADKQDDVENIYVQSYLSKRTAEFKKLGDKLLKGKRSYSHDMYEEDTTKLLTRMKIDLKSTNFFDVEESLLNIRLALDKMDYVPETEEKAREAAEKVYEESVRMVSSKVRDLDNQTVVKDLLSSADVVFCTLPAAGSMPIVRMSSVDALVDEASACTEADILIPLSKKPDKMLLVGDPKQLPSVVTSPLALECGLSRSLQDRLMFRLGFSFTLLDQQYRMRPEISRWPVKQFYSDKLQDGENVVQDTYRSKISLLDGEPYRWVQVSAQEKKHSTMSTYNEGEAEAIVSILLEMKEKYKLSNEWFTADRLRVITFYQAQVNYINLLLKKYDLEGVTVSSVDASQGCEADMVILSFVRGSSGHIGFLKDNRRLNVGLTRSRFQLVCVANHGAFVHLEDNGGNLTAKDLAGDAASRCEIFPQPKILPPPPPRARATPKKKQKKKSD